MKDDALSDLEGKPTLKVRGDVGYWYAARRFGTEMKFIYIGEDSGETRARIDRTEELRATSEDREQAAFLIAAMADGRPDDLSLAFRTAMEFGPRWRERIGNSLKRMPETKDILVSLDASSPRQ